MLNKQVEQVASYLFSSKRLCIESRFQQISMNNIHCLMNMFLFFLLKGTLQTMPYKRRIFYVE